MKEDQKALMVRREFLNRSAKAAVGISCLQSGFKTIGAFTPDLTLLSESKPAVHNMLILGTQTPYFYHLPLFSFKGFDSPHRYQVILEVTFGQQLQNAFALERKMHPKNKIYTFNPEPFVLGDLASKTTNSPLRRLKGSIFRGHLEKADNTQIFTDVTAGVRLVYFKEFTLNARRSTVMAYILFGVKSELFLAHVITGPPDFDQILSVTILNRDPSPIEEPTTEQLRQGFRVEFPQNSNLITARLRAGRRLRANMPETIAVSPSMRDLITKTEPKLDLLSNEEIYFEEGELNTPPEFATTRAEKAAGFP